MASRRAMTADERLAQLKQDQARVRRERLVREVAGPRWKRMMAITPAFFRLEGELVVRRLVAEREQIIERLHGDGIFALDTAMRLSRGYGFLTSGDVHVYLLTNTPVLHLEQAGFIERDSFPDSTLVRPWPGPRRLLASVVKVFPAHRALLSGARVVDEVRLREELIGTVGARADLFSLLDRPSDEGQRQSSGKVPVVR